MNGLKQKILSLPKDENTLVLRRNWNNKMKRIQNNEASYEEVVQMFLGLEAGANNISSVLQKITTQIEDFSKALDVVNQNLQGMEKEKFRFNLKQASIKSKKLIKSIVKVGENKEVIELISNPETTSQMFTTLKNLWNDIMGEEESIVDAENTGWWSKFQSFASKSKNRSMKFFTFLKKAWKIVHKKYPKVSKQTMILCLATLLCGGITLLTGPIGGAACYYLGYGAGSILGLKMVISGSKYAHSEILEKRFGKKSILLQLFINSFDIYEKEKAYQEPWYQSSIETLPHLLHLYRRYILSGFKNEMRASKLNFDKIMNQQANRYFNYLRKKFDVIQINGSGSFEWLKKISRGYDDIFDVDQGGILSDWEEDDEELKELKEEESNHLLELLQNGVLTIQDVNRVTKKYSTALSGGGAKKKEAMNHLINLGMDENMAAKMLKQATEGQDKNLKFLKSGGETVDTIGIFDFDDTLMTTSANNYIEVNQKKICAITPKEYNELEKYDKLYDLPANFIKNHINNYEEFGDDPKSTIEKMTMGCKNEDIEKILSKHKEDGHSIGIITARSIDSESMASFMKEHFQVNIPSDHIIAIANKERFDKVIDDLKKSKENNPFLKANWNNLSLSLDSTNIAEKKQLAMVWFISKNYKNISFYDDDPANIQIMNQLKEKLQKIDSNLFSIQAHEVSVEQRAKCKKIMDEKLLLDEQYQKLKLSGNMCKNGLQMLHQKEK